MINLLFGISEHPKRADNVLSKNTMDYEIGPSTVTLSAAKGLSRSAWKCFAEFTLSEAKWLSMTRLPLIWLPQGVTLSRSEGSGALGSEMLSAAKHDKAATHTASWINL